VSVRYLDLLDYVAIAAEVTGLDLDGVLRVARLDLADSALHAPAAGFGETEFYPDFVDKAAVLVVRLAKNHPLPDGNNLGRAARVRRAQRLDVEPSAHRRRSRASRARKSSLVKGTKIRRRTGCVSTWPPPKAPNG
jgi:death-on-curing protein